MGLPKDNSDLGRGVTLLGHVADLLDGIGSGLLHPRWSGTLVWETPAGDTLSFAVHATHGSLTLLEVDWERRTQGEIGMKRHVVHTVVARVCF